MSGSISFSTIPQNLRVPLFHAEIDNSRAGPSQVPQRALLIGQATTSVAAALRYVSSAEEVAAFAGAGSVLARMMAAYRANDPVGEVWILPMQDGGSSTAATGTIVVAGPATAAGTIALYIGGQLVNVPVASGDASTAVATAIEAAVDAATNLPVTAGVASSTVTLTAKNKGTLGNSIDIRHSYRGTLGGEALPAGITLTITAMASGATDPDLTTVAAAIGDEEFDFIAQPITASGPLAAMTALMNGSTGRWSYAQQIYGHVFGAASDSVANLLTLGAAGNDPHTTIIGLTGSPSWPAEVAAGAMGAAAVALKADPARPLQTVAIQGLLAPPLGSRHTLSQRQSLLTTGIATLSFGADGAASIQRLVTRYRLNTFGQADQSFLDVETLFTLMAVIRRLRTAVTQKFARSKLADDGTRFGPGQPVVTPATFKAELVAQYAAMEAEGLVENTRGFAAATIVQRNATDRSRLDVLYAPDLINGLRVLAVLVQFRL
ncbi:phage tail sheath subtilisin-like domain-containing protein [Roseomonas sp. F4]